MLAAPCLTAAELTSDGRTFTFPDDCTLAPATLPALVERPVEADFDDTGALYVTESSGSNEPVAEQLEKRPHRVLRLTDRDGDGVFDTRTVFADHLMLPEGCLWHQGSLFVAAPPHIWKLTDTDGDGTADRREVWFDGTTLTGCANDLHGPYRGPDGLIYWCKGAFAEQTHDLPDHPGWKSRASHVFRARAGAAGPEGLECVFTAGMDNPVGLAWTPEGDLIVSGTFFQHPGGGRRDGLIHAVPGGVWGKEHDVLRGHPRTGDLMPPMTHLGPAAPAGLVRYGRDLLCAQFNMRKVSRHVLEPDGATWRTVDSDFLSCDHPDFHPTDVLQAPDGSVLVIDTGGWYKLCCPTSQIAKPEVTGAIWRLRKKGGDVPVAAPPAHVPPAHLKRRALEALATPGRAENVPAVFEGLAAAGDDRFLFHAGTWALLRIAQPAATRAGLGHASPEVRAAALMALEQMKDGAPTVGEVLLQLVDGQAKLREAALFAIERHPEWAPSLEGWMQDELSSPRAGSDALRRVLGTVASAEFLARAWPLVQGADARRQLLDAMTARAPKELPPEWIAPLREAAADGSEEALAFLARRPGPQRAPFAEALRAVASGIGNAPVVRLRAASALPPGPVDDALVAYALENLAEPAAAAALASRELTVDQLRRVAAALPRAPVLSRPVLLACFAGRADESAGRALLEALVAAGALASLPPDTVEATFAGFPAAVRTAVADARGKSRPADQAARLDELEKSLPPGDRARGVIVFQSARASCATCHPVGYKGGRFGPDLSRVGAVRTRRDLLESVVFPSASFVRSYEPVVVTRTDGSVVHGMVQNEGADAVTLATSAVTPPVRMPRAEIRSVEPGAFSLMPQGLDSVLTPQELADVLAYLASQK